MLEMNGEYWEDTPEGQVLKHKMGGLQLATALIGLTTRILFTYEESEDEKQSNF